MRIFMMFNGKNMSGMSSFWGGRFGICKFSERFRTGPIDLIVAGGYCAFNRQAVRHLENFRSVPNW
jgi:hypothetical protein